MESARNGIGKFIREIENGDMGPSYRRRVQYEKSKLVHMSRLKLRSKGSGRKRMIDEEDEQYIAKCIEEKATAHGRRHDSTLYLGHRVKKKDLKRLLNRHHQLRGLPCVKSVTTVYNRGKAKSKKSLQAARHIGLGLWCTKKPPKSDSRGNILTHYCRATKKNIIRKMFQENVNEVLCRSYDDKATICPATGTGMRSARKQVVFMPTEPEKQRMLPIYDWPTSMVNVTPGPVLYMTKKVDQDADGQEEIVTSCQDVVVQIKPKFFVGSDATSWASMLMDNRHKEVLLHEVDDNDVHSLQLRCFIVRIRDTCRSYTLQTIEDDVMLIDEHPEHVEYERQKLQFLKRNFADVPEDIVHELAELDSKLVDGLAEGVVLAENLLDVLPTTSECIWASETKIIDLCNLIQSELGMIVGLPRLKDKVLDLTDAGPGVGLSNHAVLYRVCSEIMICKYDYYTRVHLAPNDSSNNEVERIQSSIGDAICDGGALDWDYFPKFSDVLEEDVKNWTVAEHESYEWDRMERNAFAVCEEVNRRVDGAETVDGYMKSYVSKHSDEFFFWDGKFLKEFIDNEKKSELNKTVTPGTNYYQHLLNFATSHIKKGEKVLEFVKGMCVVNDGKSCAHCEANPPLRPVESIPQPYPKEGTVHYKHIDETPAKVDGKLRDVDDFNPRVQLNKLIEEKSVDDKSLDKISQFCSKFIVDESMVLAHINDRKNKNRLNEVKKTERKAKKDIDQKKVYKDYDWRQLIDSDQLKKQRVATLDKYITHHDLNTYKERKRDTRWKLSKYISSRILLWTLKLESPKNPNKQMNLILMIMTMTMTLVMILLRMSWEVIRIMKR